MRIRFISWPKIGAYGGREANVAALPFKNGAFNLVTAFETIYFWPDIKKSFAVVLRVMTPPRHLLHRQRGRRSFRQQR